MFFLGMGKKHKHRHRHVEESDKLFQKTICIRCSNSFFAQKDPLPLYEQFCSKRCQDKWFASDFTTSRRLFGMWA